MEQLSSLLLQVRKLFETLASIPNEEWVYASQFFKVYALKKGEYYCQQGQLFYNIGFLVKGLMYSYYEAPNGDIGVKRFLLPGDPVSAYPEIIFNFPASYSSMALEDTVVVHMKYKDFQALFDRHPCWDRIVRKSLELEIMKREKREYSLFMFSAKDRYEHFLKSNESLVGRVPQYLIASALGITPEALSRIRSQT